MLVDLAKLIDRL